MTYKFKNIVKTSLLSVSFLIALPAVSQETIQIEPLFEYPMAPEELQSINDKSNYLVERFWDPMDFKAKQTVDQNALNDAFRVYSVPLRWAEKGKSLASADKLLEKLSKNPTLMLQFMKAAEECLYGPRADAWIDEIYVKFLRSFVKNKKIPDTRKKRYEQQLATLEKSMLGAKAPEFKFTDRNGKESTYFPMTTPTMIIFGDPSVSDWRLSRLKLESNITLSQAVDKGQVNIMFIVPMETGNWKEETSDYSEKWTVGYSPAIDGTFDFRAMPSIYVIDSEGKIVMKNVTPDSAVNDLLSRVK